MPDHSKLVAVEPLSPQPGIIHMAGKIIHAQGVVIFPAKCLYGIAADAFDPVAVEKIYNLKKRPRNNPILVLIPELSMLKDLVQEIPDRARKLINAFWPGNLTLVFNAQPHISPLITARTGKIGIRLPQHPVASALCQAVNAPITGTSANLSGQPGCHHIPDLDPFIRDGADLILDAGPLKGGKGSSVVDVTAPEPRILRHGEISAKDVWTCLETGRSQ